MRDDLARARKWQAMKFEAGLTKIPWEPEFGGRNGTSMQQVIFNQEEAHFDVPSAAFVIGLGMIAPTIKACGTDEQRERYLTKLLRGEEIWCQMFSEPGAGSDVASLSTTAVRDGDEWVINGQKVWTSGRAVLRLRRDHLPHEPRRGEAQGHHRVHRRHEGARRDDQAAEADERRRVVQRGLLRRRARAARERARRRQRGLDGRDHDADERARRDRLRWWRRRPHRRHRSDRAGPSPRRRRRSGGAARDRRCLRRRAASSASSRCAR